MDCLHNASYQDIFYIYNITFQNVCDAVTTGLRADELRLLKVRDVHVESHMLEVAAEHAKSGKARFLPLSPQTWELLQQACSGKGPEQFVFGNGRRPLGDKTLWTYFHEATQKAGFGLSSKSRSLFVGALK